MNASLLKMKLSQSKKSKYLIFSLIVLQYLLHCLPIFSPIAFASLGLGISSTVRNAVQLNKK